MRVPLHELMWPGLTAQRPMHPARWDGARWKCGSAAAMSGPQKRGHGTTGAATAGSPPAAHRERWPAKRMAAVSIW